MFASKESLILEEKRELLSGSSGSTVWADCVGLGH
jgi:hypothetical protein